MSEPAVKVEGLRHQYGERVALHGVDFEVAPAEVFGLLGPNGGGKTTTFRILSTSLLPSGGRASVCGHDIVSEAHAVRHRIGVVFQAPSLDKKLSVRENLVHQGHLYGLTGATLRERCDHALGSLKLTDRSKDRVETLSGGLQRRVEVAKGLLHEPQVLLLDEPSTGLDPGARRDLWETLHALRDQGVTILVTTHLMEEAERCDRLLILDHGRVVALGSPDGLRQEVGGDVVMIETEAADQLAPRVQERFEVEATVVNGTVRVEREQGHRFVADLIEAFPGEIDGVHVGKPTLEDVFVRRTGHAFETTEEPA